MSDPTIPAALDPAGHLVPIEEAIRFKSNYYHCPECKEIVNPRKGSVVTHYYAHKKGVLDDVSCPLGSQADVDEMVDDFRTSDIEETESQRQIRTYFGETGHGRKHLFGVIPTLEWDDIPPTQSPDDLLADVTVTTSGLNRDIVAKQFHPVEPEVQFELDPDATTYEVNITGPEAVQSITGTWTTDSLSDGDLFVGDQSRARRHRDNRQIKLGEWVYLVLSDELTTVPDLVETDTFGEFHILSFPAKEQTQSLIDEYGAGLTTDNYGFDADLILPPTAHPTSDAPIETPPESDILLSVTPAADLDPMFEVVSIPKHKFDTIEIEPTGPGNPRFFAAPSPSSGSKRVSIHQRNSNRHRMVHLHADEEGQAGLEDSGLTPDQIGITITTSEGDTYLSPFGETSEYAFGNTLTPQALPTMISYTGPEGLPLDIIGRFPEQSPHGSRVQRSTTALTDLLSEIGGWVSQGCESVEIRFDTFGTVTLDFTGYQTPSTQNMEEASEEAQ